MAEPLAMRQVCGVALGFTGLALMAWSTSSVGGFSVLGTLLTLGAPACWAAGSLWARRLRLPDDPAVALAAQPIAAALVLVALSGTTGVLAGTDLLHLPAAVWWVLAFLVLGSTLVGYTIFLAVNSEVSPTITNTFCYATPVVALLLSAAFLGERPFLPRLLAAGAVLSGVALMVRGSHIQRMRK